MNFRRALSAAVLALTAVGVLAACDSKIGVAASVNGTRLSDGDLNSYVQSGAEPYTDQSNGQTVAPKVFALQNWIRNALVEHAAEAKGGPITPAELGAARAALLNGRPISDAEKSYRRLGYTNKLADLVVDQSARLVVLLERAVPGLDATTAIQGLQSGQAGSVLFKAINQSHPQVELSTRYGTWDDKSLTISAQDGAGLPDFVQPLTTAGVTG